MTVVDTSVLIDVLRGRAAALTWWAQVEEPHASTVTRVELLRGMRSEERGATRALLEQVAWHPVDDAVSERAGELGRALRHSHQGIGVADLCIGATAQLVQLSVATLDVRRFPMFPGLQPPY